MNSRYACFLSLLIAAAGPSAAVAGDADDFGAEVLKCFHPTGQFRSATIGDPQFQNGRAVMIGDVQYNGIWSGNRYEMRFTIEMRKVDNTLEWKVTPGYDTSPVPANPDCRLRSWTEVD